ncbi:hypothetical protein CLU81_0465 [Flavobacterium sp. 9]|nr:hypothetical protein CLU81_0465 [Flavobacterium sp. 9]
MDLELRKFYIIKQVHKLNLHFLCALNKFEVQLRYNWESKIRVVNQRNFIK